MTAAVLAGSPVTVKLRTDGAGVGSQYDDVRVARAVYGVVADLAVLRAEGVAPTAAGLERVATMPRHVALDVRPAGSRRAAPSGFAQTIPGTTVMFTMLVLLTTGSIHLVIEREEGLLRRLAATPISRGALVLGKWWGRMALGLVQLGVAMLIGTLVFGMDWGGSFPAVAVVLVAWAAFNASFGIFLAGVARSVGQMAGMGVLVTMFLAALGGCWWPIEITPSWMQTLQLLLPTGWAMDALHRLVSFGDPARAVLPHLLALTVATALFGYAAARRFRYF